MYHFVTGPLAWAAFLIFFFGVIYRIVWYIRGLDWKLDRVAYTENEAAKVLSASITTSDADLGSTGASFTGVTVTVCVTALLVESPSLIV